VTEATRRLEALAAGVDEMRESLRAMVAGVQADGFTEREARVIVVGYFAAQITRTEDPQ
jgi:hypothetical protein